VASKAAAPASNPAKWTRQSANRADRADRADNMELTRIS
jgi:hypothetical protein